MNVDKVDYFAKNIKFLRLKKSLKQGEVCALIGFSTSTWSEYEHGLSKPRFDDLFKISAFFDVTISELTEMDLPKYDLNEILELRKIVRKYDPKYDNRYDLSPENTQKQAQGIKKNKAAKSPAIDQLNRLEQELKQLRNKLA